MKYLVTINGKELEVTVDGSIAHLEGGGRLAARLADVEGTPIKLATLGDRVYRVLAHRGGAPGQLTLELGGFRFEVEVLDERTRAIRRLSGATSRPGGPAPLVAPMPGLVVRLLVQPGDRVQPGQGVIVVEAMKMENELRAKAAAVVRTVTVAVGSPVEKGAVLVEFDPTE
jgi:pyruvate carboxylase subunit B